MPIIYDNSALQAELLIYKGDLSVKSNSYLITLKDADPKGSVFEMLKGLKILFIEVVKQEYRYTYF